MKTLKPRARVDYVKRGGKNLRDQDDVLDLLEEVMEGIDVEIEVDTDAKQRRNNNGNGDGGGGKKTAPKNDDDDANKNWCKIHDGKHLWKNCPNNRMSANYKGDRRSIARDDDSGRHRHRHRDNESERGRHHRERDRSSDRSDRDGRGRHRDSRRSGRREVSSNETRNSTSSLGSPFV